ncbi:probable basic-leucine zipper transcription factor O [Chironomus tepperi]|uniref:probable basic-leucine zipper transcription factor O n=1 Tax=Chironomus tepperi TaxID=113505 RepID=UPI00391F5B56
MLSLQLISCIIFISCIYQASLLPLKQNTIIKNNNNYEEQQLKSYYYPSSSQRANEVHDLPLTDDVDDSIRTIKKSEMMESSASNYYTSNHRRDDEDDYSTGSIAADAILHENFESEKIKPSDNSKVIQQKNSTEVMTIIDDVNYKPNITQLQVPNLDNNNSNDNSNKFSKLLFSSPSATVSTSNGPSGPFKAIICHDCENSGGVNVGHSVSFSAIKSWNVGSSNVASKSSFNDSLVQQNHQMYSNSNNNISSVAVEHTSEKAYFTDVAIDGNKDTGMQINQNVPIIENQGNVFKSDVTVNDDSAHVQQQQQQQQNQPLNKDWNYSLLTVRNENIKVNAPLATPSIIPTATGTSNSSSLKKPIFNDLLKVPYDILNAPLTEKPPETIKQTQIHINHQQKFNDTITNYQHFQQFIQKSPTPNHTGHYQSTPMPEQNYEVDESVSVMTNGRAHGIQTTTPKISSHAVIDDEKTESHHKIATPLHVTHDDAKFGVVFEGRDFRKYKVEEKTDDGFIVGEYGYLSNTDGSPIFGVRYTADSNINPQLIYDALLKFLKL